MRGRGWLLVAAAALAAVWVAAPAAVPLYDGIGFPDEAYRYVDPPAGYRETPPPTNATGSVPAGAVPGGRTASTRDLFAKSTEQGPQVEVYAAKGSLGGPTVARGYRLTAVPVRAASGQAASLPIDGDVYRVQIGCLSAQPVNVGPAPAAKSCPASIIPHGTGRYAWIALRATSARRPTPVLLYRATPAAAWQRLPTDRAGRDIYAATLRGAGDYALTYGTARSSPGAGSDQGSKGPPTTVIVLIAVLAALTVTIGAIRFTRTRRRP